MTTKELETYLILHEQKVQDLVKTKSRNWLIAFGLAVVLFIILLVVVFRHKSPINASYENQINTLDTTIKYQQKTIESLQKYNEQQDSVISNLDEAYRKNRPTETRIIHEYQSIPEKVKNLDKDNLRKEIINY